MMCSGEQEYDHRRVVFYCESGFLALDLVCCLCVTDDESALVANHQAQPLFCSYSAEPTWVSMMSTVPSDL